MQKTVQTKDLQTGMKVSEPIVGINGDIKVNKGEVLSQGHVDKLNEWNKRSNSVDTSNPRGIQIESTLSTGRELPAVVDQPQLSPLIEGAAKKKVDSTMRVSVAIDKNDHMIIREDPKGFYKLDDNYDKTYCEEDGSPLKGAVNEQVSPPVKRKGRPKKNSN